jgi:hypothetical protein
VEVIKYLVLAIYPTTYSTFTVTWTSLLTDDENQIPANKNVLDAKSRREENVVDGKTFQQYSTERTSRILVNGE